MNPLFIKYAAVIIGGGLVTLAGFETPPDAFDIVIAPVGAWLIGWAGFKRPGDAKKVP